ncbi:MAG: L-aspartate oxidase [Chloroflexales bacterium]|nr:L-aspartate oxidase [Chloroflexales bacterium]
MVLQHSPINTAHSVLDRLPAHVQHYTTPILVIGGGAAGLMAALTAAEHSEVLLLAKGALRESNSAWAQGGIAAALDDADSPRFHIDDTLIAGAGLCDAAAVETLAWEAPDLMCDLARLGVPFERDDNGAHRVSARRFALGLEGGHSQRRIVHVGDTTGWAVARVLIERAHAHPNITILEGYQAVDLPGDPGRCIGLLALDGAGAWHRFDAGATILATGGAGALYGLTSNQPIALGEGIAMAYRAGAEVADMEFVQFHPTVLRTRTGQGFLISEAVRGEGGKLLDRDGVRFMPAYDPRSELAPRDVVTRGIFAAMQRTGSDHVLLDLTHLSPDYLERRFPTIYARCRAEGIDPALEPIPVAPAAHYLMGGIRTDLDGATNLAGLFAAGECACTGVHGANRLASNSLLECLVFGRRAGAAALQYIRGAGLRDDHIESAWSRVERQAPDTATPALPSQIQHWRNDLAGIMRSYVGPMRSGAELEEAQRQLDALTANVQTFIADAFTQSPVADVITATNALLAARLIVASALLREESRGAHFRADFPQADPAWQVHTVLANGCEPYTVETIAEAAYQELPTT